MFQLSDNKIVYKSSLRLFCYITCLFCYLFSLSSDLYAQDHQSDLKFISSAADYHEHNCHAHNSKSLIKANSSFLAKINPVGWVLAGTMYLYQNVISPQTISNCPYELSCSNFSKQAISDYGWIKGVLLSADRLNRCNNLNISEFPPESFNELGQIVDLPSQYLNK